MEEDKTTININKVLAQERRYLRVKLFVTVIGVLITLVYIGYQANQLKEDGRKTREQIDCIFTFFSVQNRANKTITNPDDCKVKEANAPTAAATFSLAPRPTPTATVASATVSKSIQVTPQTKAATVQPIEQIVPEPITPTTQVQPEPQPEPTRTIELRTNPLTLQIEFRFIGDKFWTVQ